MGIQQHDTQKHNNVHNANLHKSHRISQNHTKFKNTPKNMQNYKNIQKNNKNQKTTN